MCVCVCVCVQLESVCRVCHGISCIMRFYFSYLVVIVDRFVVFLFVLLQYVQYSYCS